MKRRSMLGRRSRAAQQSPVAKTAFQFQEWRNPETPRQVNRDTPNNPFHTPSLDGSLAALGSSGSGVWSVFKNSNARTLKSPTNKEERRTNQLSHLEVKPASLSRLNKLKRKDPLSELRNFGVSNVLPKKLGSMANKPQTVPPIGRGAPIKENNSMSTMDEFLTSILKDKPSKYTCGVNKDTNHRAKESEDDRISRELNQLKKTWTDTDNQDIRSVSPPWSNGLNSLSDFNLTTSRRTPIVTGSSPPKDTSALAPPADFSTTLGVTPLESTLVEIPDGKAKERDASFTELETLVSKGEQSYPKSTDLSMALSDVSLGVNTLELLHQSNTASFYNKNWGSKFRSPLQIVIEESETCSIGKENLTPSGAHDDVVSSLSANGSVTVISEADSPTRYPRTNIFKEFQERLSDLTSRIDAAEEKRIRAEEERRELEGERKRVLTELFQFMDTDDELKFQPMAKRPKTSISSSAKKRPRYVASKLLKKEFKSPKIMADLHPYLRTPSRSATIPLTASKLNPYTPKSLRKNINLQFNSIFGS